MRDYLSYLHILLSGPKRAYYQNDLTAFFFLRKFKIYGILRVDKEKIKKKNMNCFPRADMFFCCCTRDFEVGIIQDVDQQVILIYPKLLRHAVHE